MLTRPIKLNHSQFLLSKRKMRVVHILNQSALSFKRVGKSKCLLMTTMIETRSKLSTLEPTQLLTSSPCKKRPKREKSKKKGKLPKPKRS